MALTLFDETQGDDVLGVVDHRGLVQQLSPGGRQLPHGLREQRVYDLRVRGLQTVPQHFLGQSRVQRLHVPGRAYGVVEHGEAVGAPVREIVVARLKRHTTASYRDY